MTGLNFWERQHRTGSTTLRRTRMAQELSATSCARTLGTARASSIVRDNFAPQHHGLSGRRRVDEEAVYCIVGTSKCARGFFEMTAACRPTS